ncbi:DoxX family protein [Tenacibaculum amylolyticum]|uniref:DoxX family protein n=1 Tax=Tenacibaculum amylolyticum TaxID=104269 RepID=UPI003893E47E
MKDKLFKTDDSFIGFILRITLGLVVFPHGAQKLFGWFGGYGFTGTMNYFTETVGLPWIIAFLVIILESIGAIALLVGFATRLVALGFILLALGIVFTAHLEHGFFMNWFGNQSGEGYEYFILWIGIALTLVFSGGGLYSIDRKISLK